MLRLFYFPCTSSSQKLNLSSVLPTSGELWNVVLLFMGNTELKYVLCVGHVFVSGDNFPVSVLSGPT